MIQLKVGEFAIGLLEPLHEFPQGLIGALQSVLLASQIEAAQTVDPIKEAKRGWQREFARGGVELVACVELHHLTIADTNHLFRFWHHDVPLEASRADH